MDSDANAILVVDDNAITARWVGRLVEHLGFTTVLASDGEDALNRLAEQQFVAVISDVEMPRMNGFELLQNIREFYPALPVILMSAYCDEERREATRARGAQALLSKPVNTDQLNRLFGVSPTSPPAPAELPAPVPSVIH